MQWSVFTEGKQKNELAQKEFGFIKAIKTMNRKLPIGLRLHISVALQQKTANLKAAIHSRQMQWGALKLTEEKQTNHKKEDKNMEREGRGAITLHLAC